MMRSRRVSARSTHPDNGQLHQGTPGKTEAIKPGDIVEVELEGVGVLKNTVEAEKQPPKIRRNF